MLPRTESDYSSESTGSSDEVNSHDSLRREVWQFLAATPSRNHLRCWSYIYQGIVCSVAVACVIVGVMQSFKPSPFSAFGETLRLSVESIAAAFFAVQFLLQVWSCVEDRQRSESNNFLIRLHFVFCLSLLDLISTFALIADVLVTLRYNRVFVLGGAMQVLRLLRVLTLLKIPFVTEAIRLIYKVVQGKAVELSMTCFAAMLLMFVSSAIMFHLEHDAQPEAFSNIPDSMWWAMQTLTTVGYGTIVPVTVPGKMLASIVMVFGIGLFALPAGIMGSGFLDMLAEGRREDQAAIMCPLAKEVAALSDQSRSLAHDVASLRGSLDRILENQGVILELLAAQKDTPRTENFWTN
eukprot:TRINITY_DN93929_c0_g1_i1.p1 TRINITY_DN93929_c0_g1~~TRINITY_DN93929_c0_g1_i1.p1  ORF type:complete len:365 (-),score=37.49 TRINITY_DN93929_c0_g1_i1:83-1138(-)